MTGRTTNEQGKQNNNGSFTIEGEVIHVDTDGFKSERVLPEWLRDSVNVDEAAQGRVRFVAPENTALIADDQSGSKTGSGPDVTALLNKFIDQRVWELNISPNKWPAQAYDVSRYIEDKLKPFVDGAIEPAIAKSALNYLNKATSGDAKASQRLPLHNTVVPPDVVRQKITKHYRKTGPVVGLSEPVTWNVDNKEGTETLQLIGVLPDEQAIRPRLHRDPLTAVAVNQQGEIRLLGTPEILTAALEMAETASLNLSDLEEQVREHRKLRETTGNINDNISTIRADIQDAYGSMKTRAIQVHGPRLPNFTQDQAEGKITEGDKQVVTVDANGLLTDALTVLSTTAFTTEALNRVSQEVNERGFRRSSTL